MSSKDRFSKKLLCPECGREGVAEMWEEDGWSFTRDSSTHIENLSDGFKSVKAPSSIRDDLDFQCVDHAVSALNK
jgi:Zn ribbon nucleic-acid-binding protein